MNQFKETIEAVFNPLQKAVIEKLTAIQSDLKKNPKDAKRLEQHAALNEVMGELVTHSEEFAKILPEYVRSEMPGQEAEAMEKAKKAVGKKLSKLTKECAALHERVKKI